MTSKTTFTTCPKCSGTGKVYSWTAVRVAGDQKRVVYAWSACECAAGQAIGGTDPELTAHLREDRNLLDNAEDLTAF